MREGDTYTFFKAVGEDQPVEYGEASGDTNPIHMDDDFAESVGLDGKILQGLCTMNFVHQAVTQWVGGDPGRVDELEVRFQDPVYPGDRLSFEGRVEHVEEGDHAVLGIYVKNQDGEVVLSDGFAEVSL